MVEATIGGGTTPSQKHPSEKDFELLRKEDAALEKQISKLALGRLTLIVILIILFSNAVHRRNEDVIRAVLDETHKIASGPDVRLDPITLYISPPDWDTRDGKFQPQVQKLQGLYHQVFVAKVSLLGTDLSFDLRLILIGFPLCFPFAYVYVSICREKRRLIRLVGHAMEMREESTDMSSLDLLLFGAEEGAYRKYPSILMDAAFWSGMGALIILMLWVIDTSGAEGAQLLIVFWVVALLSIVAYSVAYANRISCALRRQMQERLGLPLQPDLVSRIWRSAEAWVRLLPGRVRPCLPLVSSCVLLLATLVLQTAQLGCNRKTGVSGQPRPGYELLTGHANWPPSLDPIFENVDARHDLLGRLVYAISLALGLVGLVLAGFARFHGFPPVLLLTCLIRTCQAVLLTVVCEFSVYALFWIPKKFFIPLAVVAPLWVLKESLGQRRFFRWANPALKITSVPVLAAAAVYLALNLRKLPGLWVLLIAILAMTLGYSSARYWTAESKNARFGAQALNESQ